MFSKPSGSSRASSGSRCGVRGYGLFDDTVLGKHHRRSIELARRQYSGNAHGVIAGIGLVNYVYVNPDTDQFWLIDYRLRAV